ncbi:hypothetical protein EI94DRAFT_1706606 [Lactarius quietus]|nr:hypothetical protein EI94DRAFT_1706606 [Lactarius quietus]
MASRESTFDVEAVTNTPTPDKEAVTSVTYIPTRDEEAAFDSPTPVKSRVRVWRRFSGKDRRRVGWWESAKAILFVSWINTYLIFIPIAWVSHFRKWGDGNTFAFSFLALIPLEKLFDFGGEQLAMYCGEDLGDLIIVTLNNTVEATLAIILLFRCELKLLQSTITADQPRCHLASPATVPGCAFFTGGTRILEQQLHTQRSQLNHTLLTVGVLALTIPVAFFAAIDGSSNDGAAGVIGPSDTLRANFLGISRGFAVILLVIYIGSRFYLHDPPGENAFSPRPDMPPELLQREKELEEAEPEVNPWACVILMIVCVALVGVTAEFLVESIEFVRRKSNIEEEWFGIVLLPIEFRHRNAEIILQIPLASGSGESRQARAIDMSIQFLLFWMPFLTILGWWVNKPLTLLFDQWAEGSILIAFYGMIGISAWYYSGQNQVRIMNACTSIATALTNGVNDEH